MNRCRAPSAGIEPAPRAGGAGRARVAAAVAAVVAGCSAGAGPAAGTAPGDADRGRRLLAQYQCGNCHTIPGVPAARGVTAVPLQGLGRRSYLAGEVPNRPELLARWIAEPAALVPDTRMPDMGASDADARDMAAYLGTLE
jgi:cytochrome c